VTYGGTLKAMAPGDRRPDVDVSLAPDPVIEAYKRDVDRTLIRENLKLTPDQRLRKLQWNDVLLLDTEMVSALGIECRASRSGA